MNYFCDHQDSFGNCCNNNVELVIEDRMYVCKRCYDSHYIGLDARYFNAILEQKKVQEEVGDVLDMF